MGSCSLRVWSAFPCICFSQCSQRTGKEAVFALLVPLVPLAVFRGRQRVKESRLITRHRLQAKTATPLAQDIRHSYYPPSLPPPPFGPPAGMLKACSRVARGTKRSREEAFAAAREVTQGDRAGKDARARRGIHPFIWTQGEESLLQLHALLCVFAVVPAVARKEIRGAHGARCEPPTRSVKKQIIGKRKLHHGVSRATCHV
jgi:hypothetical protein